MTLDLNLEVGGTSDIVNVTSDIPVVETTRSQTATVVDQKAIANLRVELANHSLRPVTS